MTLTGTHSIISKVGDHDKKLADVAICTSFRDQHMLRPSTTTEVENGSRFRSVLGPVGVKVTEGPVERNSHRGFIRATSNRVHSLSHYKQEQ